MEYIGKGLEPKLKRINFDIPENLHTKIKSEIVLRNTTIKRWIIRLVLIELNRLDKARKEDGE